MHDEFTFLCYCTLRDSERIRLYVQELDVRGNNLSDNGAMIVGRSMRQMQTTALTRLDLGYNEIEDDGAFTIANVCFSIHSAHMCCYVLCCCFLCDARAVLCLQQGYKLLVGQVHVMATLLEHTCELKVCPHSSVPCMGCGGMYYLLSGWCCMFMKSSYANRDHFRCTL